ncbi:expressed unknown protein [Seminavis robusta]|uniref:Nucleolus and neural progenitor protein-like N-terminal domain-containing protein n=1 Tax=Seminavis robusta TaxID=568900 RepID=A0A9N8F4T1_9STRA|nr:expressed unknown protein [Seminavis robusta]|eukprot:Sro3700_g350480.1 n/a (362) ;mRNA; r:1667-2752
MSTTCSNHYNEALKLDVSILEALLQRNRCSLSKTKYFQRTRMALRAILSSDTLDLVDLVHAWKDERQQPTKAKRQKEDLWDATSLQRDLGAKQRSMERLQKIQTILTTRLPEILSRLEFASEPLFLEVYRGFFLPFCTVAVAALARIRTLLMRLGHQVLDTLLETMEESSIPTRFQKEREMIQAMDIPKLRIQFTEPGPQQQKKETPSKMNSSRNQQESLVNDTETAIHTQETEKSTGQADTTTTHRENETKKTVKKEEEDDDDVGQAVMGDDDAEQMAQEGRGTTIAPKASKITLSRSSKKQKTTTKKRKKDQDSSATTTKAAADQPEKNKKQNKSPKESKKEKKKKKKNKKDFFDELFD